MAILAGLGKSSRRALWPHKRSIPIVAMGGLSRFAVAIAATVPNANCGDEIGGLKRLCCPGLTVPCPVSFDQREGMQPAVASKVPAFFCETGRFSGIFSRVFFSDQAFFFPAGSRSIRFYANRIMDCRSGYFVRSLIRSEQLFSL